MIEPIDIYSPSGTKVKFNDCHGHDWEREEARKILNTTDIYTIEYIDVGDWSSNLYLKEFPNTLFNSVLFSSTEEK